MVVLSQIRGGAQRDWHCADTTLTSNRGYIGEHHITFALSFNHEFTVFLEVYFKIGPFCVRLSVRVRFGAFGVEGRGI